MRLLFALLLAILSTACSSLQTFRYPIYQEESLRGRGSDNFVVRVKIHEGGLIPIDTDGSFTFSTSQGQKSHGSGKFTPLQPGEYNSASHAFRIGGQLYKGKLRIVSEGSSFLYINHVEAFEYLVSVVGHEMNASWHLSALKAQAVLARTYLLNRLTAQGKFDVVSSTAHQVYGGFVKNDHHVRRAVRETAGEVIIYESRPAQVFYHANSGGITASSGEVWKYEHPYLVSKESPYAQEAPSYRWSYSIETSDLAGKLKVRNIYQINVSQRSDSYRVEIIRYLSEKGWREVSGKELRSMLGNTSIRSTLFDLRISGSQVQVAGRGYGHGVGMGQWDAKIMAEKYNYDYRSILQYFFPGTNLRILIPQYRLPV